MRSTFCANYRRYRRVYAVFIMCFTLTVLLLYSMAMRGNFRVQKVLQHNLMWSKNDRQEYFYGTFHYNWLRMHRARTNWREILKPCSDQMSWGSLKSGWGKVNRSSARTSYVSYEDIQPSGQFSRIFIHTRTASGQDKTIGGDFWRVFFIGPASVSATIFDHQNGTYEAIALLMEPGNYSVRAYLDYTLCDGLRNPPEDWFRIGNAQGKYQPSGILGPLDEYLYERLFYMKLIQVQIFPRKSLDIHIAHIECKNKCRSVWDGHGRWRDGRWWPYDSRKTDLKTKPERTRKGTLWIFGDSIGCRFYRSIAKKPLCNKIFTSCKCSYNWIYPVLNNNITLGRILNDDFDFKPEIILNSLRNVLHHDVMKNSESLLLLNLGLHYPISINFTTFQMLIDNVVKMLKYRNKRMGPRVIWKTTTSMRKENAQPPRNITHFRFSTEQRVRLFDSYAMSVMCNAGIEVFDVYPLSASYPKGTIDITHYDDEVFFAAETELQRYVLAKRTEKTTTL